MNVSHHMIFWSSSDLFFSFLFLDAMVSFPPELLQRFVFELKDDRPTLIICSSVSRDLHYAAQRCLFQTISIQGTQEQWLERCEAFVGILPGIWDTIEELSLDVPLWASDCTPFLGLMQDLLRQPPRLLRLRIGVFGGTVAFDPSWSPLFLLPTLQQIFIAGFIDVPNAVVLPRQGLERLSVHKVGLANPTAHASPAYAEYIFTSHSTLSVLGVRIVSKDCVRALKRILAERGSDLTQLTLFVLFLSPLLQVICLIFGLGGFPATSRVLPYAC